MNATGVMMGTNIFSASDFGYYIPSSGELNSRFFSIETPSQINKFTFRLPSGVA